MPFQVSALPYEPFAALFGLDDAALAQRKARRVVAQPRSPCRVSLVDAEPGETLILVNYAHQPAATPFQSTHAIFVREHATPLVPAVDEIPQALANRPLSLRGFDAEGMIVAGELVDGSIAAPAIDAMLADPAVDYIHLHYALLGCYAARADRA